MSFFDDGDEPRTAIRSPQPPPRRPPARARRGRTDDRTLLLRRAAAAAIVLIVLIALVLAIKAILHHQAINGLKNYNGELAALVASEQGVRVSFFHELDGAFNSSDPAEVPTTLQQYVSQESDYYHQAQAWSVPAQMVGAQRWFVGALGLRFEALEGIEAEMKDALGLSSNQTSAIELIAGEMEKLSASDVIYADRVRPLVEQALSNAGISGASTPADAFLPDIGWLVPQTVAARILEFVPSSLSPAGGAPSGSTPGHELTGVSVQSSTGTTTPLAPSGINSFAYTPAGITFVLSVLNSGNVEEHAVQTELEFSKVGLNTACLKSTSEIATTVPGTSYQSSIVFAPSSCPDLSEFYNVPLELTAGVVPVPGEHNKANNYLRFLVEFTH